MLTRFWFVISVLLALLGPILASEPVTFESTNAPATLIELFTSEGCSSCPAAEKWLSQFKKRPELWKSVVPVAYHVDYWDHLGWRDRFAKPEYTQRQRHYAQTWKSESIYTPGFAVNGREWKGFFNGAALPSSAAANAGKLRLTYSDDGRLSAEFGSATSPSSRLELNAALLGSDLSSDIKRGENSGRKLVHDFVVLQFQRTTLTKDGEHLKASVVFTPNGLTDKPSAVAAWVADGNSGAPIQATGGWIGLTP